MRGVDAARHGLFVVAFACLGSAAYVVLGARAFDASERARLKQEGWGGSVATDPPRSGAARARVAAREGRSWGRLEAPRLGLSAPVVEGLEPASLRRAAGHVAGTAFPGEPGNVVIAAHRDLHFRGLRDAEVGDRLALVTPDGRYAYRVTAVQVVGPEAVTVMAATSEPVLTLITCYPFNYLGRAPYRLVVRASAADAG